LANGSSITTRNHKKYSAFLLAVREGHLDLVMWLSEYIETYLQNQTTSVADPGPENPTSVPFPHYWEDVNHKGDNALFIAARKNHDDIVCWLLEQKKFDLRRPSNTIYILDKPACKGYAKIVRLILHTNQLDESDIIRAIHKVKHRKPKSDLRGIILSLQYWLEWPRLRLLWIGQMDNGSVLCLLPRELITYILMHCQD